MNNLVDSTLAGNTYRIRDSQKCFDSGMQITLRVANVVSPSIYFSVVFCNAP